MLDPYKEEEEMPTYGVASEGGPQENSAHDSTAHTPLLGHAAGNEGGLQKSGEREGDAGLTSSIGNLANTILGTGVLAFPLVSRAPIP